ncbi:MAG: hypothetical protein ACT4P0_03965 [Panacagrimonas sp.]
MNDDAKLDHDAPSCAPAGPQAAEDRDQASDDAFDDAFEREVMADLAGGFDLADLDGADEDAFETGLDSTLDALVDEDFDAAMPAQLRLNLQRGRQAERRLAQLLQQRGISARAQQWLGPGARADLLPNPRRPSAGAPNSRPVLESKHMDLGRYRTPPAQGGSTLDAARIGSRIRQHLQQALRYQALAQARQPGRRVTLMYQLGNASDDEARAFRTLAHALARAHRQRTGQAVAIGVVPPSRVANLP